MVFDGHRAYYRLKHCVIPRMYYCEHWQYEVAAHEKREGLGHEPLLESNLELRSIAQ
jgi:hypothetical protein